MELSEECKSQVVNHLRGSARRIQQIERAIPKDRQDTNNLPPPSHPWMSSFSGTGVPLEVHKEIP